MSATTRYQVNYQVDTTQYPVDNLVLGYKINKMPGNSYNTAQTTANPLPNTPYTFDTIDLPAVSFYSHEVYDFIVTSECPNGLEEFGDRFYLFNPICNVFTVTPLAGIFDVTWDSYIDPTVISPAQTTLKEYILEWKPSSVSGPWDSITIDISIVITAGLPIYTATIGGYLAAPLVPGNQYDIKLSTKLQYNYQTVGGPILTDILIDTCPVTTETAV